MPKVTLRLARGNDNGLIAGRSSGFVYKSPQNKKIIVITAEHGISKEIADYFLIETRVEKDGISLLLPVKDWISKNENGIDYAYADFHIVYS